MEMPHMNKNSQVDIAVISVLEFSKSFDNVGHSRLIHMLEYYGVKRELPLILAESILNKLL